MTDKTVTLKAAHTHAGRQYAAGETITVDSGTAKWLEKNGVVEATKNITPVQPAKREDKAE